MADIKGYRQLSDEEVALINEGKDLSDQIGRYLSKITESADQRWLAIGRTQLQQGMMAVTRSIAKPTTF